MIINTGNLQTLTRGFSTAFREGFGQAMATDHMVFTMEPPSMTLEEEYAWLGQFPSLVEWVGERVARSIKSHGYTVRNKKYESTVLVDRDAIEDDKYGVYSTIFQEAGRSAAAHPCQMVLGLLKRGFEELCYDGQYFFDTDHDDGKGGSYSNTGGGNNANAWFLLDCSRAIKPMLFQRRRNYALRAVTRLDDSEVYDTDHFKYGVDARVNAGFGLWQLAYGSKQDLTAANYAAARKALHEVPGDEGRILGAMPTHLVVPPALESVGLKLLNSEYGAGGETNEWKGTATLIMSPWLANV